MSKTPKTEQAQDTTNPVAPARDSKKAPWSPGAAVLYAVLVYFAAQLMGGLLLVGYARLRGWNSTETTSWLSSSVFAQFWYVLVAEALTFGAIWWFIRRRRSSLRVIGWRRVRLADPVYALAGYAGYFLAYVVLLWVATQVFPSINIDQKQELGFQDVTGNIGLLLTFLSLVVLPPMVEETVFRGFVYTGIRSKLRPVTAALLASALFAVAHLEFGNGKPLLWVAAIDTFTLSLVLCYLRQKTDSLWPGIFLHALKNGVAFVTLYLLHAG